MASNGLFNVVWITEQILVHVLDIQNSISTCTDALHLEHGIQNLLTRTALEATDVFCIQNFLSWLSAYYFPMINDNTCIIILTASVHFYFICFLYTFQSLFVVNSIHSSVIVKLKLRILKRLGEKVMHLFFFKRQNSLCNIYFIFKLFFLKKFWRGGNFHSCSGQS